MRLPVDCVVRLAGSAEEELAVALDPLPDGQPVVVHHHLSTPFDHLVDDVLDALQSVAVKLLPAWLPDAGVLTGHGDLDRRVARQLAHQRASISGHYGAFLADLADAAVAGRPPSPVFDAAVRARGLAAVIAESYHRHDVVVLLAATDPTWSGDEQRRAAALCEWLAGHGRIGVWLAPGALPAVDRYPTWHPLLPDFVENLPARDTARTTLPPTTFPALAGRPHPASEPERVLERALARCDWAAGRTWNQEYVSDALTPPIRVDLLWPTERCVVELDGDDHRGSLKYAADRRRDNGLVLDGYAVLRFTNEEILDDPHRVLGVIEGLLAGKRRNEGNHP